MSELDLVIEGTPRAQGSKVRTKWGMKEADENLRPWRDTLCYYFRNLWQDKATIESTVQVSLVFTFARPKYHTNRSGIRPDAPIFKGSKPDIDKLARAVLDSLTESRVLRDDSLVVSLVASKVYGDHPGVLVRVEELKEVVGSGDFSEEVSL